MTEFIIIILITLCAFAIIKIIRELQAIYRIKRSGNLVQGMIVDFEVDRSGDEVTYPAVVSYKTIEGEKIIATSRFSSGIKPSIGKEVWVVYSPSDPSLFYLKRSGVHVFLIICLLMFGSGMILLIMKLNGMI